MENKYSVYRQIRYARAFKPLGKMSWWRIVLGIILIVYLLLMSGFVSQMLASRMQFRAAEKLMIAPQWMEDYKPETKAFIEAGVLYQDGDYLAAAAAFDAIEDFEAADSMLSLTNVKLASGYIDAGDMDSAYNCIISADFSLLSQEDGEDFLSICQSLAEHYTQSDVKRSNELIALMDACSVEE